MKRSTPMRRSGMRKPIPERVRSVPTPGTGRGVMAASGGDVVSVQKGELAKPGKRPATVDEAERMDRVAAWGCVACRLDRVAPRPTAIHHLLRGGVRMGHRYTIGLCDPGHHQDGAPLGITSRHPWKARFEARYGSEIQLLALTDEALGYQPVTI